MSVQQVAIRLRPEGGSEVVREAQTAEAALVKAGTSAASATNQAIAANDRQIASLREVGTAAALAARMAADGPTATQRRIMEISGGSTKLSLQDQGNRPGNARADVAARSLYAADAEYERRAANLRAEIDPLGAAVDRLNKELAEYAQLAKVGAIGSRELAAAESLARARFDETTAAINRQSGGLTKRAMAGRLNLARQGADVFTTAAMGMSPAMIAIQQGPQILDAMSESGIKATGSLLLLGGALTAVAAGIAVTAVAWMNGEQQSLKLDRAVSGLGRTSGMTSVQLDMLAKSGAAQAEISIASARDQAVAYVSTGKIGGEVISTLIGLSKDYAAVMGTDLAKATEDLAKGMAEPDKMARELTRSIGLLDQKTLDHIDTLIKLGKRQEAQIIVSDALAAAISGQADKVDGVTSAWDAATRAVSNYWDRLGQALYTTPDERIAQLKGDLAKGSVGTAGGRADGPNRRREMESELWRLETARDIQAMLDQGRSETSAANQRDQEAKDRKDRAPKGRTDRSAEREAREKLARERREEDRATNLDLEISRALNDVPRIQVLQDELAVRQRIRELVDGGAKAEDARLKAMEEQGRLQAARLIWADREASLAGDRLSITTLTNTGDLASAQIIQDRLDAQERLERYLNIWKDTAKAIQQSETDGLYIATARAEVMERQAAAAERSHRLDLARASGNDRLTRELEGQEWTDRRARAIEADLKLDRGEGDKAAAREYRERLDAELVGSGRAWAKNLRADIKDSGIGDALAHQLESASDRFWNRMIDKAFDMDWGKILNLGGGGGSGSGKSGTGELFAKGLEFLFGRNANGTDHWSGGMSWVGERGPELVDLPRGARVMNNSRSMDALRGAVQAPAVNRSSFSWTIDARGAGPNEVDRLEAKMDKLAASIPGMIPGVVNDGIQRRLIRVG